MILYSNFDPIWPMLGSSFVTMMNSVHFNLFGKIIIYNFPENLWELRQRYYYRANLVYENNMLKKSSWSVTLATNKKGPCSDTKLALKLPFYLNYHTNFSEIVYFCPQKIKRSEIVSVTKMGQNQSSAIFRGISKFGS